MVVCILFVSHYKKIIYRKRWLLQYIWGEKYFVECVFYFFAYRWISHKSSFSIDHLIKKTVVLSMVNPLEIHCKRKLYHHIITAFGDFCARKIFFPAPPVIFSARIVYAVCHHASYIAVNNSCVIVFCVLTINILLSSCIILWIV